MFRGHLPNLERETKGKHGRRYETPLTITEERRRLAKTDAEKRADRAVLAAARREAEIFVPRPPSISLPPIDYPPPRSVVYSRPSEDVSLPSLRGTPMYFPESFSTVARPPHAHYVTSIHTDSLPYAVGESPYERLGQIRRDALARKPERMTVGVAPAPGASFRPFPNNAIREEAMMGAKNYEREMAIRAQEAKKEAEYKARIAARNADDKAVMKEREEARVKGRKEALDAVNAIFGYTGDDPYLTRR